MERSSSTAVAAPTGIEAHENHVLRSLEAEKLALRIERAVRRSTSDKVRELRVEIRRGGVVLHGRCGTFYSKQLAQHAAMSLLVNESLTNEIEVW